MRGFNSDEALNRVVRGTVRVMKDGNIRWSFVSAPEWTATLHTAYLRLAGVNIQTSRPVEVR